MNLFRLIGEIKSYETLDKGLKDLKINTDDLIFTNNHVKNK